VLAGGAINFIIYNHHFVHRQIFSQRVFMHASLSNLIHQPINLSHLIISRLSYSFHVICRVGDVKAICYRLKTIPSKKIGKLQNNGKMNTYVPNSSSYSIISSTPCILTMQRRPSILEHSNFSNYVHLVVFHPYPSSLRNSSFHQQFSSTPYLAKTNGTTS
jgi:hypothetical protein